MIFSSLISTTLALSYIYDMDTKSRWILENDINARNIK